MSIRNQFITGCILILGCNPPVEKNEVLINALEDVSIEIRGNLVDIPSHDFRFDYYDVSEEDTHFPFLQNQGFQGGGYSWEGIVYGAIMLSDPSILNKIRFDAEAEGLAIWSSDKTSLQKIGRLITVLKRDDSILNACIKVAVSHSKIE